MERNLMFKDGIISAALYIFCKNEKGEVCVLGGKRGSTAPSCPNMYNVPVGMREFDETAQECAQRECREETGLNIPLQNIKFAEKEEWGKGKVGSNWIVKLNGMISDYKIGIGDGENSRFEWIPLNSISKIPWAYGMDKTIIKLSNFSMMENCKNTFKLILEKISKK